MGCIIDELPGSLVHGEARRESFSIYTDFGKEGFEVPWEQFPLLEHLLGKMRGHYEKWQRAQPCGCACGGLSDMGPHGNVKHEGRFHQKNGCWPVKEGLFTNKSFLCTWMEPQDCDPPHGITHDHTYDMLIDAFLTKEGYTGSGWDTKEPVLIGYPRDGRIQLLSGSHRWAAAKEAGIKIPVLVRQRSVIEASFGILPEWEKVMKAPPSSEAE